MLLQRPLGWKRISVAVAAVWAMVLVASNGSLLPNAGDVYDYDIYAEMTPSSIERLCLPRLPDNGGLRFTRIPPDRTGLRPYPHFPECDTAEPNSLEIPTSYKPTLAYPSYVPADE